MLDRGPGLEDGEQELVLQRFHRGSAGRRGPTGSGLGLPIATELAREWGAEVEAGQPRGRRRPRGAQLDERGAAMRRMPLAAWLTLAALGLMLAGGAGVGVSKLVDQEVGLSDEPITAGEQLAPSSTSTTAAADERAAARRARGPGGPRPAARRWPAAAPPPAAAPQPHSPPRPRSPRRGEATAGSEPRRQQRPAAGSGGDDAAAVAAASRSDDD